ncbi:MAG: M23 family metallopeptidase [Candidatus Margulisiibacteriota bacterium]
MLDRFRKPGFLTFMIVGSDGKTPISFKISYQFLRLMGAGLTCLLCVMVMAFYITGRNTAKLAHYEQLKHTTHVQQKELHNMENSVNTLEKKVDTLSKTEERIRTLLGYPEKTPTTNPKQSSAPSSTPSLFSRVADLLTQTHHVETALEEQKTKVVEIKKRFDFTPSIWPIYGRIGSDFGWRRHPLEGGVKFHKGIDIPAWTGAPVKVTANGKVIYSGWSGAYGLMVVVNHGYGYNTVYGHLSKSMVRSGQTVKKGQVIAKVGTTGLTSGPHLHYEVRKWQQSISPKPFLNLNLFTANNRIW